MFDPKNITKGDKVTFSIGSVNIETEYFGRFDFLYCFNTERKMLPKVTNVKEMKISIAIINLGLLQQYGFSREEVSAILYHEVGHIISKGQEKLDGIELEIDADKYASSKIGNRTVLSALQKTKSIISQESKSETEKQIGLSNLEKRIVSIQQDIQKEKTPEK